MVVARKVVPRPVRRWLGRALPEAARNRLAPASGGPRPIDEAHVDPEATPLSVRSANLDRVADALDAAGVPWFRVPANRFERTVVAVPESFRPRVEPLLAELAGAGATVRPVLPERRWTVTAMVPGAAMPPPRRAKGAKTPTGRAANVPDRPAAAAKAESVEGPEEELAPEPVATAVYWPVTDPSRTLLLGRQHACEVEFWAELPDGRLTAPRYNRSTEVVSAADPVVEAPESVFSDFHGAGPSRSYPTRQPFLLPPIDHVDFPIDVVYTWVDGGDPAWLARKNAALAENGWAGGNEQAANLSRYISRDELRYSLRSLHMYAPWVRRIFLVTDDQVPAWLNTEHPKVTVVSHKEIFGTAGRLPTFNSMAIETRLHHIEGLAEHFIYMNDDVFLGQPLQPGFFFTATGQTRFFLSTYRVDGGLPVADEPPVMAAGKNNRAIIEREFGRRVAYKMKHTPHAARRSVLAEIEQRCPEAFEATASHQFRHPDDIAVLSSLQQHWSYLTGRAVIGELKFMYRDLAQPHTEEHFDMTLKKRPYQVFCLNDTVESDVSPQEQAKLLTGFLTAYYPFRSPYELP
ncbi:stealth conserved region 3 domain-containing protein [Actinoplanes teichomyceticus]|uniref:Stealth-like protein n=1 Tax=Actinoplanes teichomyceticus TaxID=1867 RepID=A0A561WPN2_ACTTI|nr:stealth conserved region 3 domain-containing protein [Actinoplanes teichomyceticus]TWG25820.1 Stealth-like protein [Actinoplanes teichomyceticus]